MDPDVESFLKALQTFGGLVPTSWRPWIDLLVSVIGAASVLVATVKGVLKVLPVPNAPDPKAGWGQWVAYWLIYLAEIPALSFLKPVGIATAEVQRSKKFKIPPPMPLLMLAVLCSSCATTSVADLARVSSNAVHDALALVGSTILERCKAEEDAVFTTAKYSDDARAGLAVVRAKCDPMFADFEAARLVQVALTGAVERSEPLAEEALALLAAWQALADRARAHGLVLTSPPDALHALTRGAL